MSNPKIEKREQPLSPVTMRGMIALLLVAVFVHSAARGTARDHWAFKPVERPAVPAVDAPEWQANPIDAFVYRRLSQDGLTLAPRASRQSLVRRLYYDLTGLPPTLAQVRAFMDDEAPDAYGRLIDDLLASPHYGEKWGRHWLDLVRYAETNGYERDGTKPHLWRYRDYVIDAFNTDKPYDQFIREQLAGDELDAANPEAVIATGYYRLGLWDDEPVDKKQGRYDVLDNVVDTTGQVFLGLTLGCARCHEHKIDPITHEDYHRFLAFFDNVTDIKTEGTLASILPPEEQAEYERRSAGKQARIDGFKTQLSAIEQEFLTAWTARSGEPNGTPLSKEDIAARMQEEGKEILGNEKHASYLGIREALKHAEAEQIPGKWAFAVTEYGPKAPETFVFARGNPNTPGEKVDPGFLSVLEADLPSIPPSLNPNTCGRRSVLANWIADGRNPLTARVLVNRIWQYHFGRGIVRSSNNFGLLGDAPTHPELLDWLAAEFVAGGWRLKPMHRLILTSRAYQMSSTYDEAAYAKDPANNLFWRFDMRRLTAEEIRDSVLAAAGVLNLKQGGPSVFPPMPAEVLATSSTPDRVWGKSPTEEATRRSIYIHAKRSLLTPLLVDFDLAEADSSCPVRFVTVQPSQALNLLNSEFLWEQSQSMAARLRTEAGQEPESQIRMALNLVTGRAPGPQGVERGLRFMQELQEAHALGADQALDRFCLLALNLNEFIFLD